jgi:hypothetical protein
MDKLQEELNDSLDLLEEELRLYLEKNYKNRASGSIMKLDSLIEKYTYLNGKNSNLYNLVKKTDAPLIF